MSNNSQKERFEKKLRSRYVRATIWKNGKLVMEKGRILDQDFWNKKVEKAWKERKKYKKTGGKILR